MLTAQHFRQMFLQKGIEVAEYRYAFTPIPYTYTTSPESIDLASSIMRPGNYFTVDLTLLASGVFELTFPGWNPAVRYVNESTFIQLITNAIAVKGESW